LFKRLFTDYARGIPEPSVGRGTSKVRVGLVLEPGEGGWGEKLKLNGLHETAKKPIKEGDG